MNRAITPAALERAVYRAFRLDVMALKPGNVHQYAAGHEMSVADFLHSAEVSAPILAHADMSVGERILHAARATHEAVGCNTNLGMLLLFAPLARAVQSENGGDLQARLGPVLDALGHDEARHVFEAIALAAPGGLGQARQYDVSGPAPDSLLTAMCAAQHRDRIAYQYANGFEDIFTGSLSALRGSIEAGYDVEWALVACYLRFLTQFPDSHVVRKHGEPVALRVMQQGTEILAKFKTYNNPEEAAPLLLEFDQHLKKSGINPGTSADLAAACFLVHELEQLMVKED